jgi:hypothetical protein
VEPSCAPCWLGVLFNLVRHCYTCVCDVCVCMRFFFLTELWVINVILMVFILILCVCVCVTALILGSHPKICVRFPPPVCPLSHLLRLVKPCCILQVELYHYSPSERSWSFIGWTLPFPVRIEDRNIKCMYVHMWRQSLVKFQKY